MSGIARREMFALAAGVAAVPFISIRMIAAEAPRLAVYDSRIAASRRFAANAAHAFDIAGQDDVHWRDARTRLGILAAGGAVGLTRWSDWVNLRGLLAERGLRVANEQHLVNGIFAWAMVRRD